MLVSLRLNLISHTDTTYG